MEQIGLEQRSLDTIGTCGISVIVPVYNEEANLGLLYGRMEPVLEQISPGSWEIVFVNDGSRDSSLVLLRELALANTGRVRYLSFSRNFGHQIAVSAGLAEARGEAVVIIDCDLQDPPEVIAALHARLKEGYDVVYARRRQRQGESYLKKLTARVFYRILARITTVEIPVDTGDFRIMSGRVARVLTAMPEHNKFLRGQIAWIGFRQTYVEYDRQSRHGGTTGYTYGKMIRFALDGITSFSDFPLKLASVMGFVVAGLTFVVGLYALYSRLILKDYVPGWASILITILFLGGVQLLSLGIIGEYLSRISQDVKNRPLYVIAERG
jgi:polyisoprenyl-phosphate glycosyltransferase